MQLACKVLKPLLYKRVIPGICQLGGSAAQLFHLKPRFFGMIGVRGRFALTFKTSKSRSRSKNVNQTLRRLQSSYSKNIFAYDKRCSKTSVCDAQHPHAPLPQYHLACVKCSKPPRSLICPSSVETRRVLQASYSLTITIGRFADGYVTQNLFYRKLNRHPRYNYEI